MMQISLYDEHGTLVTEKTFDEDFLRIAEGRIILDSEFDNGQGIYLEIMELRELAKQIIDIL